MEWLDRMNDALQYMEDNLDETISYDRAAALACCSVYHFQRMFSYIAGVPVSEYLRRRRLTCAALDLQNGDRVLQVALRYGYESPTAFARAFRALHGLPPSAARGQGVTLKAYPRIGFQIIIKGEAEMEYRLEEKDAFRIVGLGYPMAKDYEENYKQVPGYWQQVAQAGMVPRLVALMDGPSKGVMGVAAYTAEEKDSRYYIAVESTQHAPADMVEYTLPASTWAIFPGRGAMPGALQALGKRIMAEWLPASGYEWANTPDVELYLNNDQVNAEFEIWIPVVKKS